MSLDAMANLSLNDKLILLNDNTVYIIDKDN